MAKPLNDLRKKINPDVLSAARAEAVDICNDLQPTIYLGPTMDPILTHRGYTGSAHIDLDAAKLHGKLLGIQALVTYQAKTVPAFIHAFQEAVNDYLSFCHESGMAPEVPNTVVLSGSDYDNLVDHLNDRTPVSPAIRAAADRVDNGREDFEEIREALKSRSK